MSFYKIYSFRFFRPLLLILSVAVIFLFTVPQCTLDYINYDSAYQFFLTRHSISKIWELIPQDFSPPLYALVLKLFTLVTDDNLYCMRIFAVLPISGMLFLALYPVKELFDVKVSALTYLIFLASSANKLFISEIRPVTLAYFFVTAAVLYAGIAYFEGKRYAIVLFTFSSVCAMYTHNIAMLAMLATYIVLLCMALFSKEMLKFRKFLVSGIMCAVFYLPWLLVVINQFGNVKNHYWEGHFQGVIENAVLYTFTNFSDDIPAWLLYFTAVLIIIVNIFRILIRFRNNLSEVEFVKSELRKMINTNKRIMFVLVSFSGAMFIFYCFVTFIYPFSAVRYYYIFLGLSSIILAYVVCNSEIRFLSCFWVILFSANCINAQINWNKTLERADFEEMIEQIRSTADNEEDICFIHDHEWTLGIMLYYFPDARHYIHADTWCVLTSFDVFETEINTVEKKSDICYETDTFYTFNLTDIQKDNVTYQRYKTFFEPYSYQKNWSVYMCSVKNKNETGD